MRIAVCHYWWFTTRGGEKVLKSILELYDQSDLYLLIGDVNLVNQELKSIGFKGNVYYSKLNSIPYIQYIYKALVFIMPFFSEFINLSKYDLVLSSESGPSKNIITKPNSLHICYCHSPMRYVWDLFDIYTENKSFLITFIIKLYISRLRIIDYISSQRVDYFIANSNFIKKRINKYYRRPSFVIHPPVKYQKPLGLKKENYFIFIGQLENYKGIYEIIDTFNKNNERIKIISSTKKISNLKKLSNINIEYLCDVNDEQKFRLLSKARAFIYPGVEDFGITFIESLQQGVPIIARNEGGVLDIVNNKNGLLYSKHTKNSLQNAIIEFKKIEKNFKKEEIIKSSEKFSDNIFKRKLKKFIKEKIENDLI